MNTKDILFEDLHLLVVEKAAGVPSQSDKTGDMDMHSIASEYVGGSFIRLVHRLDRNVGGVMVFAKTKFAAAKLSEQFSFQNDIKQATKKYIAVVQGIPSDCAELTDFLVKDSRNNKSRVVQKGTNYSKIARLHYKKLDTIDNASLLEIILLTGRHHQIRAQLSNAGFPIIGDSKYGASIKNINLALWSSELKIFHPKNNSELTFRSIPQGEIFLPFDVLRNRTNR